MKIYMLFCSESIVMHVKMNYTLFVIHLYAVKGTENRNTIDTMICRIVRVVLKHAGIDYVKPSLLA